MLVRDSRAVERRGHRGTRRSARVAHCARTTHRGHVAHRPRRMLRPRLGRNLDRIRAWVRRVRLDRNFDRRIGRMLVRIGTRVRRCRRSRRRVQVALGARVHEAMSPVIARDLPGLRRRRRKMHPRCHRAASNERPCLPRCSRRLAHRAVLYRRPTRLRRCPDRIRSGRDAESALPAC